MSLQEQSLEGEKNEFDSTHVEEFKGDHNVTNGDKAEGSVVQALKDHPKVLLFCFFANFGALMYGFDNLALSVRLSMLVFQ
jgi:SP family general alpha glucoside:H+ symporter-like MFS transporter